MTKGVPILVTGVPRSGTTWLARVLSSAPGTALTGRELMNPRAHQYGLGGTLSSWTRLTVLTARQARLMKSAYRGLNPFVYSRYGHRQLLAPLPHTRVIVKDPFAMLSLPVIASTTAALPVLVFRHPAAVLASYRRMKWTADVDEVRSAVPTLVPSDHHDNEDDGTSAQLDDALSMACFWTALNTQALADIKSIGRGVVVAHEDVTLGGVASMRRLFKLVGLPWGEAVERSLAPTRPKAEVASLESTDLHDFDRTPEQVASSWKAHVSEADLETVERIAGPTIRELGMSSVAIG